MGTTGHRFVFRALVLCAVTLAGLPAVAAAADPEGPQGASQEERSKEQEQRIRALEQRVRDLETLLTAKSGKEPGATPAPAPVSAPVARPVARPVAPPVAPPVARPVAPPVVPPVARPGVPPADLRGAWGPPCVPAPVAVRDRSSSEFPGSWPMAGTDLRMKIGGYVKFDLLYDFNGTTDKSQFLMSTIPVRGEPEYGDDGYLAFLAKETRINVDVRGTAAGSCPVRAFVEGDFWNSENQFRLRHAYATYGDLLVGQTWTTLSCLESLPFMIDFAAGDALFGGREPQIRYTRQLNDRWKVAAALENLSSPGIENPNGIGGKARAQWPVLALRADCKWDTGMLMLGASATQLRWDGGSTGPTDEALQIDAVVAGRQFLGRNDYVSWNFSCGRGSGENIMAFSGSDANAVLNASGDLDTIPAVAVVLGYWHRWSEQFSSNFSYAYGWLDTPDSRAPFALKEGGILHANLIWQMSKQFSTGVEFMYGEQRTANDEVGSASRVQFMAKFEF